MTLADQVRDFIDRRYLAPARRSGVQTLTVNAGDVHREMKLKNRVPAVCSALKSKKLQQTCSLKLITWHGPNEGTSANATFQLLSHVPTSISGSAPDVMPFPSVTADHLALWRRNLLRLLDALDNRAVPHEGLNSRINRLQHRKRVPREIAALMKVVGEVRMSASTKAKPYPLALVLLPETPGWRY